MTDGTRFDSNPNPKKVDRSELLRDHDPVGYELVALIPVGYPAHESAVPKRRDIG
jgi:hypothetical protein